MDNLKIDADRLWSSLMEMAEIGATKKGGVCRLALTDLDRRSRDLFVRWCEDAGCTVSIDRLGNIFARRPGRNNDLPAVATGSHLDTQPTGGKFDGAYGVLAGLEVVRTLNDLNYETEAPVEIVVWTNEEGSRFAPAMIASGAYGGVFDVDYVLSREDSDGTSFGDALTAIGYDGPEPVGERQFGAFLETHIEQGPILEAEAKTIGVVTGAQGQRWYEVTVTGQEAHAGPTPMARRRDALVAASRMVELVNRLGHTHQPDACATVGMLQVSPNSRNTIPGSVWFTVDLRHPDEALLKRMDEGLRLGIAEICATAGTSADIEEIWHFPASPFDADCVAAVRAAAAANDLPHRDIVSGAGHDACYVSRRAPTGMIFIPCEDGISHNEIENATKSDCADGAQVLFDAVVRLANK